MTPAERTLLQDGARQIGVELTGAQLDSFERFTAELLRWNAKLNLTALKATVDIIAKHYIDSLTILPLLPACCRLLDIGSGGGFPSIPLKIVRPDLHILSVDSVLKKINFQKQAGRLLEFASFTPVHARVEELAAEYAASFDVVVARAVADLELLAPLAVPFINENGRLVAMKGSHWREELAVAADALKALGLNVAETRELRLPVTGDPRGIIVLQAQNG